MYGLLDLRFGSIVDEHYHQQHIPLNHTHTHTQMRACAHTHKICNLFHWLFFTILYEPFSQTDFTPSNPKCRHLPEHAAQFAHLVSSKHPRMKVHTNAEDVPLICDTCGMMFNQLSDPQLYLLGNKAFWAGSVQCRVATEGDLQIASMFRCYMVVFSGWYARMASMLDLFLRARFCFTVKRSLSDFRRVGSHSSTPIR